MSEAVQQLVSAAEAARPTEPEPAPEPTYTLSEILKACWEVKDGTEKDEALVSLVCNLLGIPPFETGSREAVRTQVLG